MSGQESGVLTAEQAALRRVATLVARGAPPGEVFAKLTSEVAGLFGVDVTNLCRYEYDGTYTILASAGKRFPVGGRWALGGHNGTTKVFETGRSARVDSYANASGQGGVASREARVRSSVGTPIVVDGRLWGVIGVATSRPEPLPSDTEERLESFTELAATAIANAESRAGLARLAEEQAALRRVATLVARGVPPEEVFATVIEEVGRLLAVEVVAMARYEPDGTMTVAAASDAWRDRFPVGGRWPLGGKNVSTMVAQSGRPARIDSYADASDTITAALREQGLHSSVGAPIVVEGRLWGLMTVSARPGEPLLPDTEVRLTSFTELVATAIANTEARTEVAASRARLVAATDEERRRLVRDLHDGAQQRLVHTTATLKLAQRALENGQGDASALVAEALDNAHQATTELRELAHGILPTSLTRSGLCAGVEALASRTPVPVEIDVSVARLPATVEATAYFVVAEALTNVAKHAHARHAEVRVWIEDGTLAVRVRDDGVGGALPDGGGSGLIGLADRLAAVDGELRVHSPVDGGTLVAADLPVPD